MTPLIQIQEPVPRERLRPSWQAWLALGFRPLYLLGTAWSVLAVALWVFAPQWLTGPLAGVAWHAHEMLWGFVATIAVGFLMTAGSNWTGLNPLPPRALAAAVALWAVARLGLLAGGGALFALAAAADVAFFALAGAALGRAVLRSRNWRNAGLPLLLAALAAADAMFLLQAGQGDIARAMSWLQTGLWAMGLIALLIARRVTPFFAMRAVPKLQIPLHQRSGAVQLALAGLALVAHMAGWPGPAALALAASGAIALWQVWTWQPGAVRTRPLLWILYLGHAGLGLGLLSAAAWLAGQAGWLAGDAAPQRAAWHVHLLAMGGFAVLIIGMVTRTALGHLGRPLQTDRSMVASYALVIAAAVLRLAALAGTAATPWLLQASALAWMAGFCLYLHRFAPWLVRPRVDGRPG